MPDLPYFRILRCLILIMLGYYMVLVPSWLHPVYAPLMATVPFVGWALLAPATIRLLTNDFGPVSRVLDLIMAAELLCIARLFVSAVWWGLVIHSTLGLTTLWLALFDWGNRE